MKHIDTVNADLAPILDQLRTVDRSAIDPTVQRSEYAAYVAEVCGPEPAFPGLVIEETLQIGSGVGVPVRRYQPDRECHPGSVLVYLHGGGWVFGSPATHDRFTRAISTRLGLVVVSVDYRLAPEHPFPAAFEDCLGVVTRIQEDASWIAVAGDSAGGNLTAAVSMARAATGHPIDAQLLIYPGLDAPDPEPASRSTGYEQGYALGEDDIRYFWDAYRQGHMVDERLAPLWSTNLRLAPPTVVSTAGLDPLLDHGVRYCQRLIDADVPTVYLPFQGLVHGWLDLADCIPSAGAARDALIASLDALHKSTTRPQRS